MGRAREQPPSTGGAGLTLPDRSLATTTARDAVFALDLADLGYFTTLGSEQIYIR